MLGVHVVFVLFVLFVSSGRCSISLFVRVWVILVYRFSSVVLVCSIFVCVCVCLCVCVFVCVVCAFV